VSGDESGDGTPDAAPDGPRDDTGVRAPAGAAGGGRAGNGPAAGGGRDGVVSAGGDGRQSDETDRPVDVDGRRLHPLSVPYRAVTRAVRPSTLFVVVTAVGSGSLDPQSLTFLGMVVAGIVATFAYQYGYYRRFRFALTRGTLDVASGVLSRRSREIPLRRVQNVDVGQNPLQRLMGIAAIRVETAGGGDTEAVFECLGREPAEQLRDDLRRAAKRARASGDDADPTTDDELSPAIDEVDESDREEVFALSTRSLLVLSLLSFDAGAGVISSVVGAVLSGGDPSNLVGVGRLLSSLPLRPVETALIGLLAVGVLAWVLSVVLTFARYYGFRLVRVDDGLEYERGLLQQYSGTIPVEKVQTVSLRSNLAHRCLGYLTVAVETAGYSPGSERSAKQLAVPLARRPEALRVARSVEPFPVESTATGDTTTAEDRAAGPPRLERPPRRARRRYVVRFALAVLLVSAVGAVAVRLLAVRNLGPELAVDRRLLAGPLFALLVTPVAAHLRWRSRGYATGSEHFLVRTGFWRRVTRIVPYYRVQTVVETRTVFQRRRDLASVTADTASTASLLGGEAVAVDIDATRAETLRGQLQTALDRAIRERVAERASDPVTRRPDDT